MEYQSAKQDAREEFRAQIQQAVEDAPFLLLYGSWYAMNSFSKEYVRLLDLTVKRHITHEI